MRRHFTRSALALTLMANFATHGDAQTSPVTNNNPSGTGGTKMPKMAAPSKVMPMPQAPGKSLPMSQPQSKNGGSGQSSGPPVTNNTPTSTEGPK